MNHLPPRQGRPQPAAGWSTMAKGGPTLVRRVSGLLWAGILLAMVAWSLFAWLAYSLADPVLVWASSGFSTLAEGSRGMVETYGGKAAGDALKTLDVNGVAGQLVTLLKLVAKPAIVVVWGIGMAALVMLPLLMSVAKRLLGLRR